MNTAVMFSKASDEWTTPWDFFHELHREFRFGLDVAATRENTKCRMYLGPDHENETCRDGLAKDWAWVLGSEVDKEACWMNPPYSMVRDFIEKAVKEQYAGVTTVALVPSRTDTRWWHDCVWDERFSQPRRYVQVRFIKGRLKFGNSQNSAPFPSVVIVFRGAA